MQVKESKVNPSLEGLSLPLDLPVSNQGGNAPALGLDGPGPTLPPEVPIELMEKIIAVLDKVDEKITGQQREDFGQRIEKKYDLEGVRILGLKINRDFKQANKKFKASDLENLIADHDA